MYGLFLAVFLYEHSLLNLPKKKTQLHLSAAWIQVEGSEEKRGEEMNKGQMVSSAGLCSTLQRKIPAEFEEHNDCKSELSEFSTIVTIFPSPGRGKNLKLDQTLAFNGPNGTGRNWKFSTF